MNIRAKLVGAIATAIVAGTLSGCLFDGSEEDCGSSSRLSSAAVAGCADPGDTECVGTSAADSREIRVDSYDLQLPSGEWVRSEGADFDSKPPHVALALGTQPDDENATTTELSVGEKLGSTGSTYRIVSLCDTGVAWLVPAG